MKCGHVANAITYDTNGNKVDCCAICSCTEEAKDLPDLTGRKAKCSYGDKIVDSKYTLAFFEYKPNEEYDRYYCGCYGWD